MIESLKFWAETYFRRVSHTDIDHFLLITSWYIDLYSWNHFCMQFDIRLTVQNFQQSTYKSKADIIQSGEGYFEYEYFLTGYFVNFYDFWILDKESELNLDIKFVILNCIKICLVKRQSKSDFNRNSHVIQLLVYKIKNIFIIKINKWTNSIL